ncbi:HNH endonuclease [Streptomyces sp. NPDC004732]|uniref:HNH endonuclease n=1 Tax=Streptomyces sp. NPDC004732 TaxID=3154290 RepID=UPI0033A2E4E5
MSRTDFFATDPCPRTSWRMAILMGDNNRTYKFALGQALLEHAVRGETEVALTDLASTYTGSLLAHTTHAPQARAAQPLGDRDFLTLMAHEAEESSRLGHPTDTLVDAAARSMPNMVMDKFHNLRGGPVWHRFYELTGSRREQVVRVTPELLSVAAHGQAAILGTEIEARWNIVENSFATGIGRSLLDHGMAADLETGQLAETGQLTGKLRRKPITGIREALAPFQHGRCFICQHVIAVNDAVHIDHVFPFALMKRLGSVSGWPGPDLDAVWNLAPTHATCNMDKSATVPCDELLRRLALRNEAIKSSKVPLAVTLRRELVASGHPPTANWWNVIREVKKLCI